MLRSLAGISPLPRAASSNAPAPLSIATSLVTPNGPVSRLMQRVLAAALGILLFPASLLAAPLMRVEAFPTAMGSTAAISSANVGEQYLLRVYVTDVRSPAPPVQGVFSAGSTVSFDSQLSSLDVNQTVEFGPTFVVDGGALEHADLAADRATGFGARLALTPPGAAPQLLFSVQLTATEIGQQQFVPMFFGGGDWTTQLYGDNYELNAQDIEFVGSTLEIVPEPATFCLAAIPAALGLLLVRRRCAFGRLKQRALAAALTILLFPASLLAAPTMRVDAFPTAIGSPTAISSVEVGEQFLLRVYVTDIRQPQLPYQGVFSAGSTVSFDSALTSLDVNQTVEFGDSFMLHGGFANYANLSSDSATGYGVRFAATPPGGGAPQLLFSVLLTATGIGQQEFIPILFEDIDRTTHLYGDDYALGAADIQFVGSTLQIVPEPAGVLLILIGILGLLGFQARRRFSKRR